jgi:hypothetical protein
MRRSRGVSGTLGKNCAVELSGVPVEVSRQLVAKAMVIIARTQGKRFITVISSDVTDDG